MNEPKTDVSHPKYGQDDSDKYRICYEPFIKKTKQKEIQKESNTMC